MIPLGFPHKNARQLLLSIVPALGIVQCGNSNLTRLMRDLLSTEESKTRPVRGGSKSNLADSNKLSVNSSASKKD